MADELSPNDVKELKNIFGQGMATEAEKMIKNASDKSNMIQKVQEARHDTINSKLDMILRLLGEKN